MQISINVWLETNVVIVTTNLKYTLPSGCSELELKGNELLYLEKIKVNKKLITTYKLSDYNKKLTITQLPENGELTIVTHSPLFSYDEDNLFYYANLKDLIYADDNKPTTFKLRSIYNNADPQKFPICFFTEYLYIFAGNFKYIATKHTEKIIRIYFLHNQIEKIFFLLKTIRKLMNLTDKLDLYTIVAIPDRQQLDGNCDYILNADYLPESLDQNTQEDYKHAFKTIAEKYLNWQNIKPNDKIIQAILELEYGTYETKIDNLNNNKTLPSYTPSVITNPIERWIVTQKIFETLIINLTDDPSANINSRQYAEKIRTLENSFILTLHDKNISLSLKAKLFTMPSQAKILASNTNLTINIENLTLAYDKIEMFLAVNFKKPWINLYYQTNNLELASVCLKYLSKLGDFGTDRGYFIKGSITEKLNILYILCSNYTYKSKDIMYYFPESSDKKDVYDLLNNVEYLCGNLSSISICNFYYAVFSNNLHLLHNKNGLGYAILSKIIINLDKKEHDLAIKLLSLFTNWPHMDICRYTLVRKNLIDLSLNLNTSKALSTAISDTITNIETKKIRTYPKLIIYKSFQEKQKVFPLKAIDPRIERVKLTY